MPTSNSTTTTPSRFVFRGSAVPIGGRIFRVGTDPTPYSLQSPPASALSVVGGHCDAASSGGVFRDIFSWGPTVAQSQGDQKPDGSTVTTLTASIQNVQAVNAPNVFKASSLKLTLVSTYPAQGQPSIVPQVDFGHMFLNDKEISLSTDMDDLCRLSTFERFDYAFQNDKSVWSKYRARFLSPTGTPPEFHQPIPRVSNGYRACSLVNGIKWGSKKIAGNVLELTGFGKIYFGEILMNEYSRRFTLVRLSMGSNVQADVGIVDGDPNGSWIP
jgi:hypothetical protein